MEKQKETSMDLKTFSRIMAYPIVQGGLQQAKNVRNAIETRSNLASWLFTKIDSVIAGVSQKVQPIVKNFESQIKIMDEKAHQQLDKLEAIAPTINSQPKEALVRAKVYLQTKLQSVVKPFQRQIKTVIGKADNVIDTLLPEQCDDVSCKSLTTEQRDRATPFEFATRTYSKAKHRAKTTAVTQYNQVGKDFKDRVARESERLRSSDPAELGVVIRAIRKGRNLTEVTVAVANSYLDDYTKSLRTYLSVPARQKRGV